MGTQLIGDEMNTSFAEEYFCLCVKQQNLFNRLTVKSYSLGPSCSNIVSLTTSLRGQLVKCFTTL